MSLQPHLCEIVRLPRLLDTSSHSLQQLQAVDLQAPFGFVSQIKAGSVTVAFSEGVDDEVKRDYLAATNGALGLIEMIEPELRGRP